MNASDTNMHSIAFTVQTMCIFYHMKHTKTKQNKKHKFSTFEMRKGKRAIEAEQQSQIAKEKKHQRKAQNWSTKPLENKRII